MSKIIAIHSFRGGTGKSNLTANIAANLAKQGFRVGIVDTDIQSPGIHALFGLTPDRLKKSLNHYLWGMATINEIAYSVPEIVAGDQTRPEMANLPLWLIPASIRTDEITRILQEGYNVSVLNQGFHSLIVTLGLDYLFIDTHPGINEETLLSVAVAFGLLILLRPDQQDFQGTAVTVDVARQLEVPNLRLVVNKALSNTDVPALRADIERIYGVPVAGVLPLSEDIAANASSRIFSLVEPQHPWSQEIQRIADDIRQFKA